MSVKSIEEVSAQVPAEDFVALEEKVYRTIELYKAAKEARATAEDAEGKHLDSPFLHILLYRIAFLRSDTMGMSKQVAWAADKPGTEDVLLANEANTAAYSGQRNRRFQAERAI